MMLRVPLLLIAGLLALCTPSLTLTALPSEPNMPPAEATEEVHTAPPSISPAVNILKLLTPQLRFSSVGTAYLDAMNILSENGRCSQFFGGPDIATTVLKDLAGKIETTPIKNRRVGIRMFGEVIIVRSMVKGYDYRLFEKVIINSEGPFFQKGESSTLIGSFKSNTREARALMLLHELAHLIKGRNGDWLIPDDGRDKPSSLNLQNSKLIETTCRLQLGALKYKSEPNLQEFNKTNLVASATQLKSQRH